MRGSTKGSALADVEFLARSPHRVVALAAMAEGPQTRSELRSLTGASASTISRLLRAFEDRNWIRRSGAEYEATELGASVSAGLDEILECIATERRLRDVYGWLPPPEDGFSIEMCEDSVVTVSEPDNPYGPVNRFCELLTETETFRFVGFDVPLLEPCRDQLRQQILEGMDTEIIDPPSIARYVLSTYGDHCAEVLDSGHLTVFLHANLPAYGIGIFDDRVAISGYDPDSGTVKVLVETDDEAARDWATTRFEAFRRQAQPLEPEVAP